MAGTGSVNAKTHTTPTANTRATQNAGTQQTKKTPDNIPIGQVAQETCADLDMTNADPKLNAIDYKLNDLCTQSSNTTGTERAALEKQIAALKGIKNSATLQTTPDGKIMITATNNVTIGDLKNAYNITDGAFINNNLNGAKTGNPNGVNADNQGSVKIDKNNAVLQPGQSVQIPSYTVNPQGTIENTKAFIFGLRSRT